MKMYHARVTSIHIYDQDKYKNQQVMIDREILENMDESNYYYFAFIIFVLLKSISYTYCLSP